MKPTNLLIALIIILLLSIGCGGGGTLVNGINPQTETPVPSAGTGTFVVRIEWPEVVADGITSSAIPSSITNLNIKVREGPYYTGEKNIFPPIQEAIFTGIPSGTAEVEVTATNSSGTVLSYRKTDVTIVAGKTVRKPIYLGITIKSGGVPDPNGLEINVGDTIYWYNTDSTGHTLSAPFSQTVAAGATWSKLFNQGGTYNYTCDGQAGNIYVRGNAGTGTPDMVSVKGGKQFDMGGSGSTYKVTLSDYRIGRYEVTNSEYVKFLNEMGNQSEGGTTWVNIVSDVYCGIEGSGPYTVKSGYENRPLAYVSWYGALAYCNWLSSRYGLTPCYGPIGNRGTESEWRTRNGYRLPTEAEWEYACRGGDPNETNFYSTYYWGPSMNSSNCWNNANSGVYNHTCIGYGGNHPLGLYDMSGNVWEWCNDWYGTYPSGSYSNPVGVTSGTNRVMRGGGWNTAALGGYTSASRAYNVYPYDRYNDRGFRLVQAEGVAERPEMVVIQGGHQFGMVEGGNNSSSSYQVTLSPYYIGKYETTNREYVRFLNEMGNLSEGGVTWVNIVADTSCGISGSGPYSVVSGYENRPVVYVSWYGAVAYCNWLSDKNGLSKCYGAYASNGLSRWGTNGANFHPEYSGYRLPTEAEWEYAYRGGNTSLTNFYSNYYWGDSLDATIGINKCWYSGLLPVPTSHINVGYGGSHPAGLYDMSGNVWEWCSDWYGSYPSGNYTDRRGPNTGSNRVYRGGCWNGDASNCRSAFRSNDGPGFRGGNLGFRPVRRYY